MCVDRHKLRSTFPLVRSSSAPAQKGQTALGGSWSPKNANAFSSVSSSTLSLLDGAENRLCGCTRLQPCAEDPESQFILSSAPALAAARQRLMASRNPTFRNCIAIDTTYHSMVENFAPLVLTTHNTQTQTDTHTHTATSPASTVCPDRSNTPSAFLWRQRCLH